MKRCSSRMSEGQELEIEIEILVDVGSRAGELPETNQCNLLVTATRAIKTICYDLVGQ